MKLAMAPTTSVARAGRTAAAELAYHQLLHLELAAQQFAAVIVVEAALVAPDTPKMLE